MLLNLYQQGRKLSESTEHFKRGRIFKADSFDISIYVYDRLGERRLHECERDEFFYVLKGEAAMQVEDKVFPIREGDGILVKAGDKHKHWTPNVVWMMVITKHPHKHTFYE